MSEGTGMSAEEQWLDVPGFEGFYEVSDCGRVRSVDRVVDTQRGPRRYRGVMRRLHQQASGHLLVTLSRPGEKMLTFAVHRLVMMAFRRLPQDGRHDVVLHINRDRTDNRVANLTLATRSDIEERKQADGTTPHGETSGTAHLTEEEVQEIRVLCAAGDLTQREIASMYGVVHSTIGAIHRRELWAHLEAGP